MEIEVLRERLDCRKVARHYGVTFKRRNGEWWLGSCPNKDAHTRGDKNPSFSVGPRGYKCFSSSCFISGDIFALVGMFEGLDPVRDFPQIKTISMEHAGEHVETSLVTARVPGVVSKPVMSRTRAEIMAQLWDILHDSPLSAQAISWLNSRGIDPEVAYGLGCRDWSMESDAIREWMEEWEDDDLIEAGLARTEQRNTKLWVGLEGAIGQPWAQGIGFPLAHGLNADVPMEWRWRFFKPLKFENGNTLKVMAQYKVEGFDAMPLGFTRAIQQSTAGKYVLVIAEGEPDYLSVADAARSLEYDLPVLPLGIVSMSKPFPDSCQGLLVHAHQVVCVMDKGRMIGRLGVTGGEDRAYQIMSLMMQGVMDRVGDFDIAYESTVSRFHLALQADDQDINDIHQARGLTALLSELIHAPPSYSRLIKRKDIWKVALDSGVLPTLVKEEDLHSPSLQSQRKAFSALTSLSALGWMHTQPPERRILLSYNDECMLPFGKVGFFVGEGGIGKSWALTQLAVAVATGTPWFQAFRVPDESKGPVVLAMAEEDVEEMHRRIRHVVEHLGLSSHHLSDLEQNLWPLPLSGQFVEFLTEGQGSGHFDDFYQALSSRAPAQGWSMVVLDPASRFMGVDTEKDNALATRFVQLLEQLTTLPGRPTVLCAHHTNKVSRSGGAGASAAGASRGASALSDGARWQGNLFMHEDKDGELHTDQAVFNVSKSNYGPKPPMLYLQRKPRSGVLIPFDPYEDKTRSTC